MVLLVPCTNIELVGATVRLILSSVLLLTGTLKLSRWPVFMPIARELGFSSRPLLTTGLQVLPIVEVFLGAWLFVGQRPTAALSVTLLLFTGFTVVLFVLVRRGYKGSCACFGAVDRHQVGIVHLIRNIVLILATTFALMQSFTSICMGLPAWRLPPLILATAMVLLVVAGLLYVLAAEAEALFKHAARQLLPTQKGERRHV